MTDHAYQPAMPAWRPSRLQICMVASLLLITLADWLFYGRRIGISVLLFLVALAAFSLVANGLNARRRDIGIAVAVLAIALVPLVESANMLALAFGAAGIGAFALILTQNWQGSLAQRLDEVVGLYLDGPWRAINAALSEQRGHRVIGTEHTLASRIELWVVPLLLCGVFLMLFAAANPLIDRWLGAVSIDAILRSLNGQRAGFWLVAAFVTWPLLYVTVRKRRATKAAATDGTDIAASEQKQARRALLADGTILRSLVLFNLLFALQSAMDIAYLWGGVALPDGMTYAAYAHRGAYPLMGTALLAACFVLVALRPGSSAERSPLIRRLVYLWVAQNVLLVISSILRLDLYVAAYSLTLLRVAAFIWMGLVVFGLVMIIARIALNRPNGWLVNGNLIAAGIVLYACSLTNFADIIARYNITHFAEKAGQIRHLDTRYVWKLGPGTIPAIDAYIASRRESDEPLDDLTSLQLAAYRKALAAKEELLRSDWRRWTFRGDRLWRYLQEQRAASTPELKSGQPAEG
ncbi:DUF4173 domain-containing protein [Bosea sp. BK604]|uniref:DUF4153 domain-containing protein n=1 Tax=Bosea sp. BK604 TaxID=2512180 RepID=UPI00104458E9|nr:DUF4173 domain-containing protein [Bosea sp. BK604]TCR70115.1 uncharacterized protein DUF4173 [Bosea sp. BK604]